MTTVTMSERVPRRRITATGHATGSEAVCAAVSCLLYSLTGYLHNDDHATIITQRLESANAEIDFVGGGEAYEMTLVGMLQLQQQNPEHIRVIASG